MEALVSFARDQGITGAEVSGIGAFGSATVGYYRLKQKKYHRTSIPEETEVLSLLGNLSMTEAGPRAHLHATLATEGSCVGGHLFEGTVGATLEVVVRETGAELRRFEDEEIGLPLLDL